MNRFQIIQIDSDLKYTQNLDLQSMEGLHKENFQTKKIYHLKLLYPKQYPPYKQVNPYTLLNELNKQIKQKYDIQFIQVKYVPPLNPEQRYLNDHFSPDELFKVDMNFNNILSPTPFGEAPNDFLRNYVFGDVQKLKVPIDCDSQQVEKMRENDMKNEQSIRLQELKKRVEGIMKMHNSKYQKDFAYEVVRSIQSFKSIFNKQLFSNNQYTVSAKAVMNEVVYQKFKNDAQEKSKKTSVQFKCPNGKLIKIFVNPDKDKMSFDTIVNQYRINNWSLNCYSDQILYSYFGTEDMLDKISAYSNSIRLVSSISFVENQGRIQNFSIMTFLWNQTIMKISVKLSQIKKIEKVANGNEHEFYFHLSYPPMYYINQMKAEEANSQRYIKFYDRVTNFIFLKDSLIKQNYFLKYFLFNNTILTVSLKVDDSLQGGEYLPVGQAYKKLQGLFQKFKGTIQCQVKDSLYKKKNNLKSLAQNMDYKKFTQIKMHDLTQQNKDKIWMIKYLILSMVRHNYIIPLNEQINPIINCIEEDKKDESIDCYLNVLWKTATNMWGYNYNMKFSEYFKKEVEDNKKMQAKNIMKKIWENSESIVYVLRVSLTPSGYLFNPPTPEMKGRLLKQYSDYARFFLRASICEQSQIQLKNQKYITKMVFRQKMSQINILERAYIPLGWSPSQLRSFSLWYFHPICQDRHYSTITLKRLERRDILHFLGDFSKIQNPAKKAARIGQSFSSSWTYKSSQIKCIQIDDIATKQNEGIIYTDGIGKISSDLLESISLKLNIRQLTVIQVRYKGAKGVLVLDPQLGQKEIHLRKSMIKYQCTDKEAQQYLDILDWNKYKAGYLNRQIIILLVTLRIDSVVFTGLQKEHLQRISKMTFKDCSIFKYMGDDVSQQIINLQPAQDTIINLLNAGFQLDKQPFFRGVLETLKKNGYHQLKMKSNIRVEKSARIIGIVDECGVLEQNQVYCSIYDHYFIQKSIKQVVEGQAIITRNPCLHPADIRKVRCIGKRQIQQRFLKIGKPNRFKNLWNVVIMPAKGKYPLTSQISGSDLDGDNFFICWDERLIPKQVHPPVLIDEPLKVATKKQQKQASMLNESQNYEKMLDFFIDYTNYEKLGQIDNSHLVHADKDLCNYANNKQCLELAKIHGKAVDFPKTGYCPPVNSRLFCSQYPDFMQKQNANSYISQSILGKLYRDIKQRIQNLLEDKVYTNVNQIDKSLILDFNYDQTEDEVKQCLKVLIQYERQMSNIIFLLGVDSEYEIYSGNFSTVKNKIKTFGRNRLIASILSIRERFFAIFFEDLDQEDEKKYKNINFQKNHMKKPKYFLQKTRRKAQLYYLVSYIRKFSDLKQTSEGFIKLKQKIEKILEQLKLSNLKENYCGFIWFVIPKIILNLKITWKASQNENGDIENNQQIIQAKEDEEDDQEYM